MKISIRRSDIRSKLAATALLGALTVPFLTTIAPVQAQPRIGNFGNRNRVFAATVLTDLRGNDRFTVRFDNGRTAEVIDRQREPLRLSKGDRIELRGDFEQQFFIADSVRILVNKGGNSSNVSTTIYGRVVADFAGRDFEVRRDNGTIARVRSLRSEPIRLSKGDRVTLQGHFEDALFVAQGVNITRNDDNQKVDFPGTVLRRVESGRLSVRGDNGHVYTVIADASLLRFDRNDRVRIKGFVNGDIVSAQKVEMLKNR